LTEMFPRAFKNLRLFAPDAYDFILSKLERNSAKDRDDADYIFKTKKLSSQILRERYEKELRPYLSKETWHDSTLKLVDRDFREDKLNGPGILRRPLMFDVTSDF
jgi:hypothetical protein